mmetsp:Transcript_83100/g.230743  ORF Transcript_83100/g.230743 Transcript_83100/m.230743 type:complete len:124 (+) Transcript_83100:570-941(+)
MAPQSKDAKGGGRLKRLPWIAGSRFNTVQGRALYHHGTAMDDITSGRLHFVAEKRICLGVCVSKVATQELVAVCIVRPFCPDAGYLKYPTTLLSVWWSHASCPWLCPRTECTVLSCTVGAMDK